MKKISLITLFACSIIVFTYCSAPRKAEAPVPVKIVTNYQANIKPIVELNCAPCHFPDKGGNKKALDSYSGVSSQIDETIRRIQLNPGERGFMPSRHPKLSDSTINVFKQWKADGLAEK